MDLADERLRHRIMTNGPVGPWCTLPGTHTQLFDEAIHFHEDGTGELRTASVMHGARALRFAWRVVGYGVLECQPTYDAPEIGADGEPEALDRFRLPFVIEQQNTDTGSHWVLREDNAQGFWEMTAPLVPDGSFGER
jgi:hypothetical protein